MNKKCDDKSLDAKGVAYLWKRVVDLVTGVVPKKTSDLINDSGYVTNFGELSPEQKAELRGPKGEKGDKGPQGPAGVGVPAGGTTGQVLKKKSNSDFDTEWGAGGSGTQVQADWNESDTSEPAFIKNKPTIPSEVTESTVAGWGFTKNTGTYSKPIGGIPSSDMSSAVQTSLGKADTALQTETDPTVPSWAKASSKPSYTAQEVGALPSSTVIPTITFRQW